MTLFPPTNKLFVLPCVPPYPLLREYCVLFFCLHSVAQLCLTLCDPIAYRLPGFSVHGIFQAKILEWATTPFSRGSSQSRGWTHVSCISCIGRQILYHCTPGKSIKIVYKPQILISLSRISLSLQCRHKSIFFFVFANLSSINLIFTPSLNQSKRVEEKLVLLNICFLLSVKENLADLQYEYMKFISLEFFGFLREESSNPGSYKHIPERREKVQNVSWFTGAPFH